ncbi:MAG: hypothetical protein WEB87_03205 [Bacteriovoracaceae bacterium]
MIGENIQHSLSPSIYAELLGDKVDYTLLDYEHFADIPPLKELLGPFDGVSVTAPYKKFVFKKVDRSEEAASRLQAVNAVKLENGFIWGANTDAKAFNEIFKEKFFEKNMTVLILGDGAMSKVAKTFLETEEIDHKVLSRKLGNLQNLEGYLNQAKKAPLIINACSREFTLDFASSKQLKIWDFNYDLPKHSSFCHAHNHHYFDGKELLFRQARYALRFWNL